MARSVADLRRPLGPCSVLTSREAAAELHMGERAFRHWATERGMWIRVEGRRRVLWRSVLDAIEGAAEETAANSPASAPAPPAWPRISLG